MATNIEFTGSIPEIYDKHLGPLLFEPFAEDLSERISNKNSESVLELACGTGRLTNYLFNKLHYAKIISTDINPDMISFAKKKVTGENIEWMHTDMQEIPFEDSIFDLVICQFGVMFVPDKIKAFKEINRVLKPGGTFLFNTWDKLETNKLAIFSNEFINTYFMDDPITFYHIPFSYFTESDIKMEMNEGGFKNTSFTLVAKAGKSESAAHAAIGFVEGNPVSAFIKERDPKLISVIRDNLANALAEKFGNNPMTCSMNAIVVETVK